MEDMTAMMDNATSPADNGATIRDAITMTTPTPLNPSVELGLLNSIRYWYYLTVIPIGIIGNLLTLLVVMQKQNRSVSCSVYMGALAVADLFTLLGQGCLWMIVNVLPGTMAMAGLSIMCKVSSYTIFSAAFGGVMIILALLVERVIAVTWPLKAAVLLSPKRAVIIVIIISAVALAYNIPIIFTATMVDHFDWQCISVMSTSASTIYQTSKLILSGVLPFVAILAMNLTILCAVKSTGRKKSLARSKSSGRSPTRAMRSASDITAYTNQEEKKMSGRERQLTVMTVVMSLCFLCLTIPKYAHQLAFISIDWQRSEAMTITFGWSAVMTQHLYVLNSVINFFLYCMTGSKFRADLRKMFRFRGCKKRNLHTDCEDNPTMIPSNAI